MLLPPLLRSLEARRLPSRARRRQPWCRRRPLLEALENRRLLATIVVNNPTDTPVTGQTDLRQAIALAATTAYPGADTITFDSSVFGTPKTITLYPANGQLTLDSDVTIAGPSVGVTIARSTAAGTPDFRIMGVNSGVTATLENLTITGGKITGGTLNVSSGGGILNSGTLTLTNSTLSGNSAGGGGGILNVSSGGGILNSGTLTLTNSTLSGNSAGFGGGIQNIGTATLTNSTLSGNSAFISGGGILNDGALTLTNSTLSGNSAVRYSGGIINYGTATLTNSTLSGNSANSDGGGITNVKFGTVLNLLTLTNSTLSGNSAGGSGGGIENLVDGTLTLTNSTLSGNSAGGSGGGIENLVDGTATLTNSTLSDNKADVGSAAAAVEVVAGGGGISNSGTATLTNSTLSGNSATDGGGIENDGMATLTNSTLSGNSAANDGGGIHNFGMSVGDSTAPTFIGAMATLNNTIVANSPSGHDVVNIGTITGSHNLIETAIEEIGTGVSNTLIGTITADPKLGPLQNNGGPTQTMALLAGSPAINAGDNTLAVDPTTGLPLATDQRGAPFVRIAGGTVDIGAYEAQTLHLVVTTTADENNSNYNPADLSLREAIELANANPGTDTITFQIPGAGVQMISLLSALPTITDPVIIDGYTQQPGASPNTLAVGNNAVLLIELNGASAPPGTDGLIISAGGGGSTITGLVINGFGGAGIQVDSSQNLIEGNFLGTDPTGTVGRGNTLDGISLNDASNNTITGNVVSGNGIIQDAAGINLVANDSNNTIAGNEIGTNAAGDAALGNSLHGIFLGNGASRNVIGPGNVISGNGGPSVQGVGVYLDGTTTQSNSIIGNFIGTNAAGTAAITASIVGVLINNAPDNTIGGLNLADRNIISGNSVVGVYIAEAGATGNAVQNNYIGTDVRGLAGIPNGVDGIYINGAPRNTIGGTAPGTGNLISANRSAGIQIFGAGATNNQILRNRIGLDANGRLTLPNGMTGIFSQISIQANDFGFSTVNRNLGQVLPWQSPSSIGGGTVSGASQAAVAAHRKASRARSVSGHHGPLSKRKTVIVTAVHSYPNAKLALGLSRKSPASGRVKNLTQVAHSRS